MSDSGKILLNRRLHLEGRWDQYEAIREQLKRDGVNPRDAWRIAAQQFPPQDGSPIEVEPPSDMPIKKATPVKKKAKGASPTVESFFDSTGVSLSDLAGDDSADESYDDDGPPVPPPPPKASKTWVSYSKGVTDAAKVPEVEFNELLLKVVKRKVSVREIADWVFENSMMPLGLIDPATIPSAGALRLLKWTRASDNNYNEFIRNVWSKMMPTKGQLDNEDRFSDDGRRQLSLLEDFERSLMPETEEDR